MLNFAQRLSLQSVRSLIIVSRAEQIPGDSHIHALWQCFPDKNTRRMLNFPRSHICKQSQFKPMHLIGNAILTRFPSQEIVKMTTSGTASDANFVKWHTFLQTTKTNWRQCMSAIIHTDMFIFSILRTYRSDGIKMQSFDPCYSASRARNEIC